MTTQTGQAQAQDPRVIYNQGVALLQAGRRNEALARFMTTIAQRPDIAEAWWQAALIFLAADNFTEALRHAEQACLLRPEEPTVWATWADAVAICGAAEAERRFLDALRTSKLPTAIRLRLQDRFGAQRKAAKGAAGRATRPVLDRIARLLAEQNFGQAVAEATKALRDAPDSALLHNMRGVALAAQGRGAAAMPDYQAAVRIDPFFADAFFNMAREHTSRDEVEPAKRMARAAIARAPGYGPALMLYGDLLVTDFVPEKAVPFLERAVASGHRTGYALQILAQALINLRQNERALEMAEASCTHDGDHLPGALSLLALARMRMGLTEGALEAADRALAIVPDHAEAIGRKAMTLQTLGRFDEARPLFLRAMELNPKNGSIFRSYMTSTKAKPGDPIVDRMIDLIDRPGVTPRSQSNFAFAIAKALEDQKEHTRAFPYLKRANDIMAGLTPYDHKARLEEIARFKAAFAGTDWTARQVAEASVKPTIFVTGMPRSGTTLIEQIISSHSRVTGGDELDILPRLAMPCLQGENARGVLRAIGDIPDADIAALGQDYLAELARRFPGSDVVTDKSINSYMFLGVTKLALPNARFIVVRRDPRDNLLSIYRNRFPEGAHLYAYDLRALAEHYATFVEMVEFWRSLVPGWFTEVQYEELVANPEEQSRRLIAACGLDWEEACLDFHRNDRQVRTLSVYQVRQPISGGSVKAWQRYERELAPMIEVLAERGLLPD